GTHFIAAEFIDGATLRRHIAGNSLPLTEALDIAIQIASALDAAHEAGIIHRDIKPENVMLRRDGLVKVLDFGLAKLSESVPSTLLHDSQEATPAKVDTLSGAILGTPRYMSPEQARGEEVDARTDVFSLGLVLYEMLAGEPPFSGANAVEVLAAILEREPQPLTEHLPEAPAEAARIVHKALSKDRGERYQSAKDLLTDLREFRDELSLAARRDRALGKPDQAASGTQALRARFGKRRLVSVAALIVLLASATWFFYARRAPMLTEKDTILLADFENRTGDAVFDSALAEALSVQLAQTPFLNLLPVERVRETLQLMQRNPNQRLTRELAREICLRQGLRAWIGGSIAQLGARYVIKLEAMEAHSGEALASALHEAESKDRVLYGLGQVASDVRAQLGESLASRRQFNQPLEQATTASLPALEAYSRGVAQSQLGRPFDAIQHYLRAVEFDPDFAIAHARLASAYSSTNQPQRSIEQAARAFDVRARASQHERLNIEMIYYSNVTRELDKRFEIASLLAQIYPRDPGPHGVLAAFHVNRGRSELALSEAREAVRLSAGKVAGYFNPLVSALLQLNRFDEAKETLLQAQARQLKVPGFARRLYEIGFVQNDATLMQAQLDWVRDSTDEMQTLDWQAQTAAFSGRLGAAQVFSQRASAIARQRNLPEPAAVLALEAVLRLALLADERHSKNQVARAAAQAPNGSLRGGRGNALLLMAPLSLALSGNLRQAQSFCDEAAHQNQNNFLFEAVGLPVARAAIALKLGQAEQAVSLLEAARPHEPAAEFWPNYLRAQAYLDARRGIEAAAEFQKIIDHRGWDPTSLLWPMAHLGLARAAALNGDAQLSAQFYQAFFNLWREADADLPLLKAARREFPTR
ncbi:MAG TPA: protein kinase, partial [Blastocatellia bacterium]|nr:protein kinase [Blastocatellia bacterium]